ncbi:outer membrane lipoprotein [Salmonella enterica subsp. enterica]|uniref:Outer-membrane lipoprotein LolB n=1 Tax=Salmonella enterica I TaxID=59201 RepID=A0A379VQ00_SALET|nr:outer membrane lipoprotein [Salmonella enterica subsp. enterica]
MTLPDFRLIRLLPLASLVLTACTLPGHKGPGKSPDSPQWRQHQQEVRHLNQYQTRGAFAYISDDQKVYARFFWQQTGQDRYRLLLTNPLGSTELELNAQPGNVQLVDNKGQRYTADDAEEMIGQTHRDADSVKQPAAVDPRSAWRCHRLQTGRPVPPERSELPPGW